MIKTETDEVGSVSLLNRAQALRDSVLGRVDDVADSAKAQIAGRRFNRRRDELLRELGMLHVAATGAGELDLNAAEQLLAEIAEIDASLIADEDSNSTGEDQ